MDPKEDDFPLRTGGELHHFHVMSSSDPYPSARHSTLDITRCLQVTPMKSSRAHEIQHPLHPSNDGSIILTQRRMRRQRKMGLGVYRVWVIEPSSVCLRCYSVIPVLPDHPCTLPSRLRNVFDPSRLDLARLDALARAPEGFVPEMGERCAGHALKRVRPNRIARTSLWF